MIGEETFYKMGSRDSAWRCSCSGSSLGEYWSEHGCFTSQILHFSKKKSVLASLVHPLEKRCAKLGNVGDQNFLLLMCTLSCVTFVFHQQRFTQSYGCSEAHTIPGSNIDPNQSTGRSLSGAMSTGYISTLQYWRKGMETIPWLL